MYFQAPSLKPPTFAKATAGKQACGLAAAAFVAAITSACAAPVRPVDTVPVSPPAVSLPLQKDSIRFAVIGDTGTGGAEQYRLAQQMIAVHSKFPFEFVLLTGDNMYGAEGPRDFVNKFEAPYAPLLKTGVKFYASLGNHDETDQIFYKPFNMDGKRFGIDPLAWTSSERWIRCPACPQARPVGAPDGSSLKSSRKAPCASSWTKARRSAPSPASWI